MMPYYSDKYVTIYNADCREILPDLPKVDLVLTDPPYGIGKAGWDTRFILPDVIPSDVLGLMPGVWNILSCPANIGELRYKWQIIAHLINGMTRGGIGFGNYIPCLIYVKEGVSVFDKSTDCKDFVVGSEVKPEHPSPKPERPVMWFIDRLSKQGNTIIDPFLGSGTTCYCAKKLLRKSIGIEIEEKYCEIAAKRCSQMVMEF